MGIGNDIGQYKFRNSEQKAVINLIFTHNWLTEKMKILLDPYQITIQQFNILRILRGAKSPISTLQLRHRMLDKMSDTSRMVDRLIRKKLVEKKPCDRDKRLVDISITESGLELLARIDLIHDELDGIVNNLNSEELESFSSLLDKIRGAHPD